MNLSVSEDHVDDNEELTTGVLDENVGTGQFAFDTRDFYTIQVVVDIMLIDFLVDLLRDVDDGHVDGLGKTIQTGGHNSAIGQISIGNTGQGELVFEDGPTPGSPRRLVSRVTCVYGLHRVTLFRIFQLDPNTPAEWKHFSKNVPATLWIRKAGGPLSKVQVLGLGDLLNY